MFHHIEPFTYVMTIPETMLAELDSSKDLGSFLLFLRTGIEFGTGGRVVLGIEQLLDSNSYRVFFHIDKWVV